MGGVRKLDEFFLGQLGLAFNWSEVYFPSREVDFFFDRLPRRISTTNTVILVN